MDEVTRKEGLAVRGYSWPNDGVSAGYYLLAPYPRAPPPPPPPPLLPLVQGGLLILMVCDHAPL